MVGEQRPLHPLLRDEVYRIGREALINAFRHARARNIEIELNYLPRQFRVVVRDDGCGIDPEILESGRDGHWGLPGMRRKRPRSARVSRFGAELTAELKWNCPSRAMLPSRIIPPAGPLRLRTPFRRGGTGPAPSEAKDERRCHTFGVLSVDDHPLLREGIAMIINNEPDMQLVAQAATGAEAIRLFREHKPDVTLMDLSFPT